MTDGALRKGRNMTDEYKHQLHKLVEQWLTADKDAAAVVAALGEVTAEAAMGLMGPQVAIDLMNELVKSIEQRKKRAN